MPPHAKRQVLSYQWLSPSLCFPLSSAAIVERGVAWAFVRYSRDYVLLEEKAQAGGTLPLRRQQNSLNISFCESNTWHRADAIGRRIPWPS